MLAVMMRDSAPTTWALSSSSRVIKEEHTSFVNSMVQYSTDLLQPSE